MSKILSAAVITIVLGIFVYGQDTKSSGTGAGIGSGRGGGYGTGAAEPKNVSKPVSTANSALKILSKPRPAYTDAARENNVQGNVTLMITFKKNGQIGAIKVVKGLPDGLSESAVKAARLLKFEPPRKNGKPITISKIIEYNFTLY